MAKKTKTKSKVKSIADTYSEKAFEAVRGDAEIVLADFARKDDERQRDIAVLTNQIEKATDSLPNPKTCPIDHANAQYDLAVLKAQKELISTLRTIAGTRKDSFIAKFDTDPYAALTDRKLVHKHVVRQLNKG